MSLQDIAQAQRESDAENLFSSYASLRSKLLAYEEIM